jgi:hypothetical protein
MTTNIADEPNVVQVIDRLRKNVVHSISNLEYPNRIAVIALGAAAQSRSTLINICRIASQKYTHSHIIIMCFDPDSLSGLTIQNLKENNFECKNIDKNIDNDIIIPRTIFEKKDGSNLFTIFLTNISVPTNPEIPLMPIIARSCLKQQNVRRYIDYVLQREEYFYQHFQDLIMKLLREINANEIIFMNDLFFNMRGYGYLNDDRSMKFVLSSPIEYLRESTPDIDNIAAQYQIELPTNSSRFYGSFYDSNLLFSETIWVIKLMRDLSVSTNITIMDYGIHLGIKVDGLVCVPFLSLM